MKKSLGCVLLAFTVVLWLPEVTRGRDKSTPLKPEFHTSDRCLACHNQLTTPSGRDVSIGLNWRSSIMANSARDPYWQASVRREIVDHPEAQRDIEDECSVCHMPVSRYQAKLRGEKGEVFAYLPFSDEKQGSPEAQDGVTCTICHQISKEKLGTRESFNGGFVIPTPATKNDRSEYGPFAITAGNQHIMNTSTGGFLPSSAEHIRDSALCGSCHQLYTTARDAQGKVVGTLPEQMPYLEWLHSDYPGKSSCQGCHMPEVPEQVQISSVLGVLRSGLHQHVFVGGNFLMQRMLNRYRNELGVAALPNELTTASDEAIKFLQSQSARVSLENVNAAGGKLQAEVIIQNLTGHKLPTAYPSRRAWLHFVVRDHNGQTVFESGGLNPDGSIQGNDNDTDKSSFEPHYREINIPDQVEIFESILKDSENKVTTGLIAAVGYLKDNRLLPTGFDKTTAEKDIAVIGDAAEDPTFGAGGGRIRYSVDVVNSGGPYQIQVELLYQPIGFRWAHNLSSYQQTEPQRFVRYYESMASSSATILAHAEATK
jgi:hypothetical protein